MLKDHGCGDLRASHSGRRVRLAGWVNAHRDHGGVLFFDVRDSTGLVQVVVPSGDLEAAAERLRAEWCVSVAGTVRHRPEGTENPKLPTGAVEVMAEEIDVLSGSPPLPFQIADDVTADENVRLRYRYLDLRRGPMLHMLRTRAAAVAAIRRTLDEAGFIEIETPYMARSTPEGARDFLVPSRLQQGSFYALIQSPQLFKQILMVAGTERYYQIARCFRDEDLRANRQPEHTQLDLEMSFVKPRDVQEVMEQVIRNVWRDCLGEEVAVPFERMSYAEAVDRFGTDRPDLRAGPAVVDLSAVFEGTGFNAFAKVLAEGGAIRGLRVPAAGVDATRAFLDGLIERAKELGAGGLVWMAVEPDGLRAPITKFLSATELEAIRTGLDANSGDLVLLVAGEPGPASEVLGTMRVELAWQQGRVRTRSDPRDWRFLWVVDFPMFEWNADERRWDAMHNPFSSSSPETAHLVESDPGKARSMQYDLVINGEELAGGSIRNHRPEAQMQAFRAMGFTEDRAREGFGFFLDALAFGAPPHGGIAMGIDRLSMVLVGATSIRDAMAFPKTQTGSDLMTGAPAEVAGEQLRDLGLQVREKKR